MNVTAVPDAAVSKLLLLRTIVRRLRRYVNMVHACLLFVVSHGVLCSLLELFLSDYAAYMSKRPGSVSVYVCFVFVLLLQWATQRADARLTQNVLEIMSQLVMELVSSPDTNVRTRQGKPVREMQDLCREQKVRWFVFVCFYCVCNPHSLFLVLS